MTSIAINDLEYAINYWRETESPGDGITLGPAAATLATVYGEMIYQRISRIDDSNLDATARMSIQIALGFDQKITSSQE